MKLIARKDFRNNCKLKITGAVHENHVHKGAQFEIDEASADGEQLIAQLNAAHCIADGSDEKAVKAILAEVAAEEKKAKAAATPQK